MSRTPIVALIAYSLRVWFKKSEVPEDQWIKHAREKAAGVSMWTLEALKPFVVS
jgi:hypothetical protein